MTHVVDTLLGWDFCYDHEQDRGNSTDVFCTGLDDSRALCRYRKDRLLSFAKSIGYMMQGYMRRNDGLNSMSRFSPRGEDQEVIGKTDSEGKDEGKA